MKFQFRITQELLNRIHQDLSRPHPVAQERVGFIVCRVGAASTTQIMIAESYVPVDDADYLASRTMGALMGPAAIRKALQHCYQTKSAMFHVHRHEHRGLPSFSPVDVRENAKFIPDFWKVAPARPHGAIVLSWDRACAAVWDPNTRAPVPLTSITAIGFPCRRLGAAYG
jgi:hypothetical protein